MLGQSFAQRTKIKTRRDIWQRLLQGLSPADGQYIDGKYESYHFELAAPASRQHNQVGAAAAASDAMRALQSSKGIPHRMEPACMYAAHAWTQKLLLRLRPALVVGWPEPRAQSGSFRIYHRYIGHPRAIAFAAVLAEYLD